MDSAVLAEVQYVAAQVAAAALLVQHSFPGFGSNPVPMLEVLLRMFRRRSRIAAVSFATGFCTPFTFFGRQVRDTFPFPSPKFFAGRRVATSSSRTFKDFVTIGRIKRAGYFLLAFPCFFW